VTDAIPESDLLEERSSELLEHERQALPEGGSEADAADELHEADEEALASRRRIPRLREDVNEADALDQATPVGFDDEEEWR
jgi:hypothetical protein